MPRRVRRLTANVLAVPFVLLLVSCGGGPGNGHAPCSSPPPGVGPGAGATLQVEDGGGTYCLKVGDQLTVFLRVPLDRGSSAWQAISASDTMVLEPGSAGLLALPRGVTGAVYRAARGGTVQLTSARPPCADSGAACNPSDVWRATIVVRN